MKSYFVTVEVRVTITPHEHDVTVEPDVGQLMMPETTVFTDVALFKHRPLHLLVAFDDEEAKSFKLPKE